MQARKALTAFRNVLKRRGTIEWTEVKCLLTTDSVLEFRIRFKFLPKVKDRVYEAFVAARAAADKHVNT